jgi:hypothetical protein
MVSASKERERVVDLQSRLDGAKRVPANAWPAERPAAARHSSQSYQQKSKGGPWTRKRCFLGYFCYRIFPRKIGVLALRNPVVTTSLVHRRPTKH